MDEQSILGELGLGRHEATLYLALLRLGETTAVALARDTKLHRRTVYDTLERLSGRGLASVKIRSGVTRFSPADPGALELMLEQRQAMLRTILPGLSSSFHAKRQRVSISIFEGADGMKMVFSDLVRVARKRASEVVIIGAGLKAPPHFKYTFNHYVNSLTTLRWRLIEPDLPWIRKEMNAWNVPRNFRFLSSKYLSPLSIVAFADRTLIVLMEPEPVVIQIMGKQYATGFRNYFELLWQASKP